MSDIPTNSKKAATSAKARSGEAAYLGYHMNKAGLGAGQGRRPRLRGKHLISGNAVHKSLGGTPIRDRAREGFGRFELTRGAGAGMDVVEADRRAREAYSKLSPEKKAMWDSRAGDEGTINKTFDKYTEEELNKYIKGIKPEMQ